MRTVSNSVETINAAATAIVTAESRVQPTTVQKRRWGSCFSLYWCFGSHKHSKRIGHAVLVPEPVVPGVVPPAAESLNHSTSIALPFFAPPSSPASFLQSDPPSSTQSPAGSLSLSFSMKTCSPGGPSSIFAIGPYAYETQLVSPPVFSTFTTEPSTASFTPPPESVQLTTPPSPDVPFAQLLTSSLNRSARRSSGTNQRFMLSHYEYQPYPLYPGSPGGHLISPGSAISNSGTSSPLPDRRPILELRLGEAPKILGFEYFTSRKWGSRLSSGSLTPDGTGLGSRLGSGSLTPDGTGLGSRLGSGSLTPDGAGPASRDSFLLANQISEVASLANSENGSQNNDTVIDHRVSFELTGDDVATCPAKEPVASLEAFTESSAAERDGISRNTENCCEFCVGQEMLVKGLEKQCGRSIKEFNFDYTKGEVKDKHSIGSEWWVSEKIVGNESSPSNNWTFFPMLQPRVS